MYFVSSPWNEKGIRHVLVKWILEATIMNKTTPTFGLARMVIVRFAWFFIILALLCFIPAGTWNYWQGWMYIGTLLVLASLTFAYLLKNDPALLERRMRFREREGQQKKIIGVSLIFFILEFLLPGLDQRFGWSQMPVWVAILGDVIVIAGYLLVIWVFKTNSHTSRIVEVEAGQKVISTGPYAFVRHPMYVGVFFVYGLSPLALGSYWALIPGLMILPVLVLRILSEERLLLRELDGYRDYTQKVKYRLLPGVW
jgi:protein-S-isoprenylcysteine O-methyltransferase Ste14